MKNFRVLLGRELKSIGREKTIMFAIMIQFVIASLSSILMVGIMAFYDPSSISANTNAHVRLGLVQEVTSPLPNYLMQKGVRVKSFGDMTSAKAAFQAGQVDAVMRVPDPQNGVVNVQLVLPQLDTSQTVILMLLQDPLKKYENYLRGENGIQLNYTGLNGKSGNSFEFLYSIIVPILMLFPALIAGSIIIDTICEEFENKTFETLMASPVSLKQIFSAKVASAVVVAAAQVVLWVGLLRLNGTLVFNPLIVILIAVCAAAVIALIAAFVAIYFKDRERSQFIYSMVLVAVVAGSTFAGLSPITLITRLASNTGSINYLPVILYPVLLAVFALIFFTFSKKLVYRKK